MHSSFLAWCASFALAEEIEFIAIFEAEATRQGVCVDSLRPEA